MLSDRVLAHSINQATAVEAIQPYDKFKINCEMDEGEPSVFCGSEKEMNSVIENKMIRSKYKP